MFCGLSSRWRTNTPSATRITSPTENLIQSMDNDNGFHIRCFAVIYPVLGLVMQLSSHCRHGKIQHISRYFAKILTSYDGLMVSFIARSYHDNNFFLPHADWQSDLEDFLSIFLMRYHTTATLKTEKLDEISSKNPFKFPIENDFPPRKKFHFLLSSPSVSSHVILASSRN